MPAIAFIHPDLGIGGAERLVVDAGVGLQNSNHKVHFYTSHCDKSHCFEEVSSGQLAVTVYGDFFPTQIAGRLHILFAIIRQLYLVFKLVISGEIANYDYFIVDQLLICLPFLQLFAPKTTKILFYCHFPDKLLAKRDSWTKLLYRYPFDWLEEWTTGLSDRIVVNLKFTKSMFHKVFPRLADINPGVIYPCVDIEEATSTSKDLEDAEAEVQLFFGTASGNEYFLSVNRFEAKKQVDLAIRAFQTFRTQIESENKLRLVIAGGFDARVAENVITLAYLDKLCEKLGLKCFTVRGKLLMLPPSADVVFLPSVKSLIKTALIRNASLLTYTPSYEHFGIVPVEGMLNKTAVLVVNNGGPVESVVDYNADPDNATGFVREPTVNDWSETMYEFYNLTSNEKKRLGENGFQRAQLLFLREQMTRAFEENLEAAEKHDLGFLFVLLLFWKVYVGLVLLFVAILLSR